MNATAKFEFEGALSNHTLVLFLGADLPREVTGLPSRADLAHDMARRYRLDEALSLAEVAQRVSQAGNRFEFTDFIRNALDTAGKSPSAFHQSVVKLMKEHGIQSIITTAYDDLLEVALRQAGIGINRVVHDSDVSFIRPDRLTLIKLYGDAQQPETLVVTDRDHSQLLRDRDKEDVIAEVRQAFKRNTILFYGYNLSDPDFKFLFDQIAESKFARLAYAVWPGLSEADGRMWRDRGIVILAEDLLKVLSNAVTLPAIAALRTNHDFFVALDPAQGGMLIGNAEAEAAEPFTLLRLDNGKVALKASTGNYVTAVHRGRWSLLANARELSEAQQFDVQPLGDGHVSFKTAYRRYVTAMDDQPGWHWELRAEASQLQDWEKFTLVPVTSEPAVPRYPIERASLSLEEDRQSLERQLQTARENISLIEERKAEYVLGTEVPLQLIKEERRLRERIVELEAKLGMNE